MMIKAEIWGIAETDDGYMVFIKPLESVLVVPIFVGQSEAHAILLGFGGVPVSRPLTVDLLQNLAKETGYKLHSVQISELKDNTYYGRMIFDKPDGGQLVLDSRPSDALALSIRCKTPIYIAEDIVEETGIPADELETSTQSDKETQKMFLKEELDDVLAREDYERAAEIRDMLNLLNN